MFVSQTLQRVFLFTQTEGEGGDREQRAKGEDTEGRSKEDPRKKPCLLLTNFLLHYVNSLTSECWRNRASWANANCLTCSEKSQQEGRN